MERVDASTMYNSHFEPRQQHLKTASVNYPQRSQCEIKVYQNVDSIKFPEAGPLKVKL